MQSERSDDKFCDDIFGETPTGVRKSVSYFHDYLFLVICLLSCCCSLSWIHFGLPLNCEFRILYHTACLYIIIYIEFSVN